MSLEIHIIEKNHPNAVALQQEKENVILFNEEFYLGELTERVGDDVFWKKRYAYFESKGVSKLTYYDQVIKPLTTLQDLPHGAIVYFWFANNEFSMINLRGLLTYVLTYYRKDINYYLISEADNNLEISMQSKARLSRNKLVAAQEKWQLFVQESK